MDSGPKGGESASANEDFLIKYQLSDISEQGQEYSYVREMLETVAAVDKLFGSVRTVEVVPEQNAVGPDTLRGIAIEAAKAFRLIGEGYKAPRMFTSVKSTVPYDYPCQNGDRYESRLVRLEADDQPGAVSVTLITLAVQNFPVSQLSATNCSVGYIERGDDVAYFKLGSQGGSLGIAQLRELGEIGAVTNELKKAVTDESP